MFGRLLRDQYEEVENRFIFRLRRVKRVSVRYYGTWVYAFLVSEGNFGFVCESGLHVMQLCLSISLSLS